MAIQYLLHKQQVCVCLEKLFCPPLGFLCPLPQNQNLTPTPKVMKRKYIILCCLSLLGTWCPSSKVYPKTSVEVKGQVLDQTGKGVANAVIEDAHRNRITQTNPQGWFAFEYDKQALSFMKFKVKKKGLPSYTFSYRGKVLKIKHTSKGWIKFGEPPARAGQTIRGVVIDQKTRKAVNGARVLVKVPNQSPVTVHAQKRASEFSFTLGQGVDKNKVKISVVGYNVRPINKKAKIWKVIVSKPSAKPQKTSRQKLPLIKESMLEWQLKIHNNSLQQNQKEYKRLEKIVKNTFSNDTLYREHKAKLGYLQIQGTGTNKNVTRGLDSIRDAAEPDPIVAPARTLYGDYFHLHAPLNNGRYEKAKVWYRYAAKQGKRYALIRLAHLQWVHLNNKAKAKEYLEKAYRGKRKINVEHYLENIQKCHLEEDPFLRIRIFSQKQLTSVLKPYQHLTGAMVYVAGGKYKWRNNSGQTTVPSFAIGKYEVTVAQYLAFMEEEGDSEIKINYPKWMKGNRGKYPMVNVSWKQAKKFCRWLSKKTGHRFRLPIEYEWEFAALGGRKSNDYAYAGSNNPNEVAWHKGNTRHEGEQGKDYGAHYNLKKPNELGIYNMSGNVEEWCYEWHFIGKYSDEGTKRDPTDPPVRQKAITKGGSWYFPAKDSKIFEQHKENEPESGHKYVGFRVVMITG